jgi:hypothetical protein
MIGYCPIEFDEPQAPVNPPVKRKIIVNQEPDATTECNYVVMFFIVGVIALAAMDSVRK